MSGLEKDGNQGTEILIKNYAQKHGISIEESRFAFSEAAAGRYAFDDTATSFEEKVDATVAETLADHAKATDNAILAHQSQRKDATSKAEREFERFLLTLWADTDERKDRDALMDEDLRDKLHQAFFVGFRYGQGV